MAVSGPLQGTRAGEGGYRRGRGRGRREEVARGGARGRTVSHFVSKKVLFNPRRYVPQRVAPIASLPGKVPSHCGGSSLSSPRFDTRTSCGTGHGRAVDEPQPTGVPLPWLPGIRLKGCYIVSNIAP